MTRLTRLAAMGTTVVVFSVVAACSTGSAPPPRVPEVFDLNTDAAAGIAEVDPHRGEVVPADELRLLLERHMAWHGITLVEAMRGAAEDPGGSEEWTEALVGNTDDLTKAVGLVYGPTGARAFHQLWAQHTQFLVDYAAAAGKGDRGAMAEARRKLDDYVTDSGSFFDIATAGGLPAATARSVLRTHVDHMMDQVDAAVADDRARSLGIALDDHDYLVGVADALAGAIAGQQPAAFPGSTETDHADHVSTDNEEAGAMVITALGTRRPVDRSNWPAAFLSLPTDALDSSGWTDATTDLSEHVGGHDHAAMIEASKQTLTAADTVSRGPKGE